MTSPLEKIKAERDRHGRKMEEIKEEFGIMRLEDLIISVRDDMEEAVEVNEEFRDNLFPLLCEMTEGDRVTISKEFTLKEGQLYHYSSSKTVSAKEFIYDCVYKKFIGDVDDMRPNPYAYLRDNISEYGVSPGTGDRLEEFLCEMSDSREYLVGASKEFIRNFGDFLEIEGDFVSGVHGGRNVAIGRSGSVNCVCSARNIYNPSYSNFKFVFLDGVEVDGGVVQYDSCNYVFDFVKPMEGDDLIDSEDRIRAAISALEQVQVYVNEILGENRRMLDMMDSKFAPEKVKKEL
jgi:hypothetical protein